MRTGLFAALALYAAGCTTSARFTVISDKNLGFQLPESCRLGIYEAEVSRVFVLGLPVGLPNPADAVDAALAKAGGNVMVDAQVYHDFWSAVLFGEWTVKVRGTVYKVDDPKLLPQAPAAAGGGRG
ncbi:MAG TPA: hypothetical protein VKE69_04370 [Planctomycetota bacterium]|nr:hypothetical protein [Planctomycetota bacterium]